MQEIAELGWSGERRPRGVVQIKNNVQRAIYEIREIFGHEIILNRRATYRLNTEYVLRPGHSERSPERREPIVLPDSFEAHIRRLLQEAKESEDFLRGVLWGNHAALVLRENSDELLETVQSGRQIRLVCADGQLAVDIIAQMIWKYGRVSDFCDRFRGWIEMAVMTLPLGAGVAWIDRHEDRSRLHAGGPDNVTALLGNGPSVNAFLAPLEERMAQLRAMANGSRPLLFVDRFDSTLAGQAGMLWTYFKTKIDGAATLDPALILSGSETLCGPSKE